MTKRTRSLVALLAASTLVVAACGSDDDSSTESESTTESTAESTAEATEEMTEEATEEMTEEATDETETTEAPESTEAPTETTETTEPPVVRAEADLVIWADDTRTPVITPLAEEFGAANGITTAVQEVNFGDIRDKLVSICEAQLNLHWAIK